MITLIVFFVLLYKCSTACLGSSGICQCTVSVVYCTGREGFVEGLFLRPASFVEKVVILDSLIEDSYYLLCGSGERWIGLQVVEFQNCRHNCDDIERISKCTTAVVRSTFCGSVKLFVGISCDYTVLQGFFSCSKIILFWYLFYSTHTPSTAAPLTTGVFSTG
jgi:hypothetical protein